MFAPPLGLVAGSRPAGHEPANAASSSTTALPPWRASCAAGCPGESPASLEEQAQMTKTVDETTRRVHNDFKATSPSSVWPKRRKGTGCRIFRDANQEWPVRPAVHFASTNVWPDFMLKVRNALPSRCFFRAVATRVRASTAAHALTFHSIRAPTTHGNTRCYNRWPRG